MTKNILIVGVGCLRCNHCLKLGCPAIIKIDATPYIDASQCVGCGLCIAICPHGAIETEENDGWK